MGWITAERRRLARRKSVGEGQLTGSGDCHVNSLKVGELVSTRLGREVRSRRLTLKKTARKVPARIMTFFLDGSSNAETTSSFPVAASSPANVVVSLD